MQDNAMPKKGMHAARIHPEFMCRTDALQCCGNGCHWSCCSQVLKKVAQERNEPLSQDEGLHNPAAASFWNIVSELNAFCSGSHDASCCHKTLVSN